MRDKTKFVDLAMILLFAAAAVYILLLLFSRVTITAAEELPAAVPSIIVDANVPQADLQGHLKLWAQRGPFRVLVEPDGEYTIISECGGKCE